MIDVVYVAASTRDARFTRICVASVREFYPTIPIRLLPGDDLDASLVRELATYWDVGVQPVPAGAYGWGYVKLEALFGPAGERFLMLDSDTILTGPVLAAWTGASAFLVDDEQQSEADERRLYYDWRRVSEIDPAARAPRFVFNTGQWFGTAGVLRREDFSPWVDWGFPRKARYPDRFSCADQGILNYVVNQKVIHDGLAVERRRIMRWPGHTMEGLELSRVIDGTAPALVVHWAGMKTTRLGDMAGSDLLRYFEHLYYRRLPGGTPRKAGAAVVHVLRQSAHAVAVWTQLGLRRLARTS